MATCKGNAVWRQGYEVGCRLVDAVFKGDGKLVLSGPVVNPYQGVRNKKQRRDWRIGFRSVVAYLRGALAFHRAEEKVFDLLNDPGNRGVLYVKLCRDAVSMFSNPYHRQKRKELWTSWEEGWSWLWGHADYDTHEECLIWACRLDRERITAREKREARRKT